MTLRAYRVPKAWPFPGRSPAPALKPARARAIVRVYRQHPDDCLLIEPQSTERKDTRHAK
jgi:hypothetical protein